MGRRRRIITRELIDNWTNEGRGQGEGYEYKPWLTVHDFSSSGRVHRIKGWKHGRVHHLFSDLERNVFFHYQFPFSITDIREQFPLLPFEETLEIAREMGVQHPVDPRSKHPVVMTTDLFLKFQQGLKITYLPRTVKYLSDLRKPRVLAKLEIERRYWERRRLILKIITEQHISKAFVKNMIWLHPCYRLIDLYPLTASDIDHIARVLTYMILNEDRPLSVLARMCDDLLKLETNTSLLVIRHLLATQYWQAEIRKLIRTKERLVLLNSPKAAVYYERRIA